jgi:phosphatidylglycerophosphate synthase
MRSTKIQEDQENPVDHVLLRVCDGVAPFLKHNFGWMTPNKITTVCVVASYLAARALYYGDKASFVLWAVIAYFLDCLDGHFARKYDMCSVFGDYYDHITDWLYYGSVFFVAFAIRGFKSSYKEYSYLIYAILGLFAVGMMWHFGCQESLYALEKDKYKSGCASPTLNWCQGMCKNPEQTIFTSRWFGSGTFNLLMIIIIYVTVR